MTNRFTNQKAGASSPDPIRSLTLQDGNGALVHSAEDHARVSATSTQGVIVQKTGDASIEGRAPSSSSSQ